MNAAFFFMVGLSVVLLIFKSPETILPSMMEGGSQSLEFAVKLFTIYAIWISLMKVLEKSKTDKVIASALKPVLKGLFKGEEDTTYTYLGLNTAANLLGMGGAATPMGLKAMETMKERKNRIMLVVLNSCSIQLIPTTIMTLRAAHGGKTDIILPTLIASLITTTIAVVSVKIFVK